MIYLCRVSATATATMEGYQATIAMEGEHEIIGYLLYLFVAQSPF